MFYKENAYRRHMIIR